MVDRPKEGICYQCGSENLVFKKDGTGRCRDCNRVFNWKSYSTGVGRYERSGKKTKIVWGKPETNTKPRRTSVDKGFLPSRVPASVSRRKPKRGFVWLGVIGIIMVIVGYSILFSIIMDSAPVEDPEDSQEESRLTYPALLLTYVGVMILCLGMFYGAATATHLDDQIRAWLIISMAILMGLFLSFGNSVIIGLLP